MAVDPGIPGLAVINFVSSSSLGGLRAQLTAAEFELIELDGSTVTDAASLFAAFGAVSEGAPAANWDAFTDDFGTYVWGLDGEKAALIWDTAQAMLEGGLKDLVTAADVFSGLARQMYGQDLIFVTFFAGEGPNFPERKAPAIL